MQDHLIQDALVVLFVLMGVATALVLLYAGAVVLLPEEAVANYGRYCK